MSLYGAAKSVIKPTTDLLWQPQVEGAHHIPAAGPVILACNHLALIDPLFVAVAAPRPVIFIAKQEFFTPKSTAHRVLIRALRAIDQLSIERRPGQASQDAMKESLAVLNEGRVFGIFPEGTRSPDGRLHRGHTGLAWLALSSGAPVVPAALSATQAVWRPGRRLPSFNRVGVRFGAPVDLSSWSGQAARAKSRREATDAIMAAIQGLSGQPRVPRYAASVKAELTEGA